MRWVVGIVFLATGCRFSPGAFTPSDDALAGDDASDGPTVDMAQDTTPPDVPIDADPCQSPYARTMHGCHAIAPRTPTDWTSARTYCMGIGGDLPIVDTSAESDFLALATGADVNARVWIGLSGASIDGTTWTWLDGQTVATKGLNRWNAGEPGSGDIKAVIRPGGTWAGRAGTEPFIVVCEK